MTIWLRVQVGSDRGFDKCLSLHRLSTSSPRRNRPTKSRVLKCLRNVAGVTHLTLAGHGAEEPVDDPLDIFQIAHNYTEGRVTMADLEEWLVPRLGVFLADPDSTPSQLAGLIELSSADLADGESDEAEVRRLVLAFLREHEIIHLPDPLRAGASNSVNPMGPIFAGESPTNLFNPFEPQPAGR